MQQCRVVRQATHIFDGLERWPTHVAFLAGGRLERLQRAQDIPELAQDRLLELVERCACPRCPFRPHAPLQLGRCWPHLPAGRGGSVSTLLQLKVWPDATSIITLRQTS